MPLAYYEWKAHSNSGIGSLLQEATPIVIGACALLGAVTGIMYDRSQGKDTTRSSQVF